MCLAQNEHERINDSTNIRNETQSEIQGGFIMSKQGIIVDTSVILLLSNEETGSGLVEQREFYSSRASGCAWHVTTEIKSELDSMQSKGGNQSLHDRCLDLLEQQETMTLPPTDLETVLQRDDVQQAWKDINTTMSDRRDENIIARAVLEGFQFFTHDFILCKRANTISGLELVSWHLRPQQ